MPDPSDGGADRAAAIFANLFAHFEKIVTWKPGWSVAEFGVGKRGFARHYAERFADVVGIDIEDYSHLHPGVRFCLSDGDRVSLPDRSMDLVVSHSVLEHVRDLGRSLSEINRITKAGGYLFLTVSPLYFSGYGSHLNIDGRRLDGWQHLDPESPHYLTDNPMPNARTQGHHLNKLTSSAFLSQVGRQPWTILRYDLDIDLRPLPAYVDVAVAPILDLRLKGFRFVGQKLALPEART